MMHNGRSGTREATLAIDEDAIWGQPRRYLRMSTYPDRSWQDAYERVMDRAATDGLVLAPERLGHANVREYAEPLSDAPIGHILLHKEYLTALPLDVLRALPGFACFHENAVFYCLEARDAGATAHLGPVLQRALTPAPSAAFVHVPKTGGASVVSALRRAFPAFGYFGTREEFRAWRGAVRFRSVAGHFLLSDLDAAAQPEGYDLVFALVRDPVARFLSAVAHARRPFEDVAGYPAGMRAMRDRPLHRFVEGDLAFAQLYTASIFLGHVPEMPANLEAMRDRARERVDRGQIRVFDVCDPTGLERTLGELAGDSVRIPQEHRSGDKSGSFTPDELRFAQQTLPEILRPEADFVRELTKR